MLEEEVGAEDSWLDLMLNWLYMGPELVGSLKLEIKTINPSG